ncbi:transcriptional regulator [Sphaerochaeta pleomorpha str. Grapes]|uniref:Transcriptional regulator n=2 Tax=Sphaerochaeta TaxID=399320 RepID=G8QV73_SPHPG|nr:transcriptional regulator [Sphaerochaeta pleomorpha str. Grapes]
MTPGGEKKYVMVYSYIRTYIDQKKFTMNTKIPSENFLCSKFSVSRETVRTAIKKLTEEGYLYSVQGSGTFFHKAIALSANYYRVDKKIKIGLIAQGQDFNASSNIVQGIKHILNTDSVELKIFITDNKIANERKCLESCYTGFDGLIVDGVKASILNSNLDCYSTIYEKDIRVIFFNNYYMYTPFPKVIIDDALCADTLIHKLVECGHRYVAGIFVYDNYQGIEKYKGYVRSLLKYGAVFDDKYVKWCISDETYDKKNFPKSIMRFIKSLPKATAIVCCNYMIMEMVREMMALNGKSIPGDYSLVCFDYSNTDWEETGITSSIHPGFEMGVKVGKKILEMVNDPNYKEHDYSYVFPPNIYEGTSIKDIR